jgi:CheY-like chemotaxis protein
VARVLLVDDDLTILDLLAGLLEQANHKAWRAGNARDAMAIINGPGHFDLAIIDLVLKDTPGIELIKQLRQRFPSLPVVAISGYISPESTEIRAQLETLGVRLALSKPLSKEELLTAVEQAIGKKSS